MGCNVMIRVVPILAPDQTTFIFHRPYPSSTEVSHPLSYPVSYPLLSSSFLIIWDCIWGVMPHIYVISKLQHNRVVYFSPFTFCLLAISWINTGTSTFRPHYPILILCQFLSYPILLSWTHSTSVDIRDQISSAGSIIHPSDQLPCPLAHSVNPLAHLPVSSSAQRKPESPVWPYCSKLISTDVCWSVMPCIGTPYLIPHHESLTLSYMVLYCIVLCCIGLTWFV